MTRVLMVLIVAVMGMAGRIGTAASSPEQEIRAMETLWNETRARADIATLDRILVDDWTVTHANGTFTMTAFNAGGHRRIP